MIGAADIANRPRLAGPPASAAPGPVRHLVCRAAGRLCAVPLAELREVMRMQPVRTVTPAPDWVLGVSALRGEAVPVIDTGRLLGDRASRAERLLALRVSDRTVALAVDSIEGIRTIPPEIASVLPPLLAEAAEGAIAAVGQLDAELLFLLRTASIIPEDLQRQLAIEECPT
jgi:purine-binding chemotaxis protein CheW